MSTSPTRTPLQAVAAAMSITIVDGFDAFSMSLAAPLIATEYSIDKPVMGAIFASTLGGMIAGALLGGALADKVGRLRVLLVAMALFAGAALGMVWVGTATDIIINRVVAGVGLGAAAPIAVSLLSRATLGKPSDLMIAVVWAGIAVGGVLASAFNYLAVPTFGWRSIFLAGAIAPVLVAAIASVVFRSGGKEAPGAAPASSRIAELFHHSKRVSTVATALMFFFGYVTTSMIVNWLPFLMTQRDASPLLISVTFAAVNIGGLIGSFGLGFASSRLRNPIALPLAWLATGALATAIAVPSLDLLSIAAIAILSASFATGAQALSVAYANALHRDQGLEATSVGLMTAIGRVGQFSALSASGALVALLPSEQTLFVLAGASALAAALVAFALSWGARRGR